MNIIGWLDIRKLLSFENEHFKLVSYDNSGFERINCTFLGKYNGLQYRFEFFLMFNELEEEEKWTELTFDIKCVGQWKAYHPENYEYFHRNLKEIGKLFIGMQKRYESENEDRLQFITGNFESNICDNIKRLLVS
jgi:hypothetical protein